MSRLSLKNDFKDGEILYGAQINTSNDATVAAVNDNYEEILKLKDIKADVVNVDNQLKTKVDVGTFNDAINSLNDSKADKSVVNQKADKTELANKADLIYVNNELSKKADISYVDTQLTQKANLSDVNSKLSLKADKATTYTKDEVNTTIDNKIVSKADKTDLNSKADKSSLGDLSQLLTSDKSSAVAAINETIREGVANNIDALSITKSNDNKIQTVGVIDSNAKGYATKTWTGTRNEYNSIQNKNANTLYYIIDDDDEHELVANKVKTIDENSNNTQYPSAKAVYDKIKESAPDLSNYVQYDNYAVSNKGGVIKGNLNGFNVNSSGTPSANVYNKENYDSANESVFISKGTLENIKDDYVGTSEPVKNLNASLIDITPKNNAGGTDNTFDDGLESPLYTLGGDGQSIQDGTPTPDTPVEINSIEGSLEFACNGRNLLPNNASSQTINDVTFIVKDDGSVIINGTATARANLFLFANNENPIKLIPGNYSLNSGKTSGGSFLQIEVKNLLGESRYITSSNTSNNYVVIDEGDVLVAGYIGIDQGQTVTNDHIYPVFQKGATSTKYEQYVEPNEVTFNLNDEKLSSVGDVKDEFVIDLETGDYYKLNNIRHLELAISDMNNTENYPGWNNTPFIKEDFPNLQTSLNKNNSSILCNILTQPTDLSTSGIGINTIDGEILYLSKSKFNLTQTQWKEQYPDLIFKLDYVIPDTEKIKLGTLSSEDLAKLKTFKGYNNVTVNTNLGLMNIRFTYGLDIKKYVDNKIAEISTAMIEEG